MPSRSKSSIGCCCFVTVVGVTAGAAANAVKSAKSSLPVLATGDGANDGANDGGRGTFDAVGKALAKSPKLADVSPLVANASNVVLADCC